MKLGDTLPVIDGTLVDGAGVQVPLGVSDVVILVATNRDSGLIISGAATVLFPGAVPPDANAGRVRYKLTTQQAALLEPGSWDTEWQVIFASGDEATFPNFGYDVLVVSPRII